MKNNQDSDCWELVAGNRELIYRAFLLSIPLLPARNAGVRLDVEEPSGNHTAARRAGTLITDNINPRLPISKLLILET